MEAVVGLGGVLRVGVGRGKPRYRNFPHHQVLVRWVFEVERHVELGKLIPGTWPVTGSGTGPHPPCMRAKALLWRDLASPSSVSRSKAPINRCRTACFDVCHSVKNP